MFCDRCGRPQSDAESDADHLACQHARALEPPRFCGHCARRMVVQVLPTGWTARCVEHGTSTSVPA